MPTKPTIQDQTFLFTGTLIEFTRDEAESLVEANGGKVISGVTAKLNFLVVGEDAGSKLDKAEKLGTVKILTEKEFLKMVPKAKKAPASAATTTAPKAKSPKPMIASGAIIIGDFEVNEKEITTSMENAAKELKKFGKDWIIPRIDQLQLMYDNRKLIKGYTKDFYWSSSSAGSGMGGGEKFWVVNFKNGGQKEFFERVDLVLRPIKMLKK
jgi:hypothetical protein